MAQAEIIYRDQQLLFPATDDIEVLEPRRRTDRRLAFSAGGVSESAMVLPFEEIDIRVADVVQDSTEDDLKAWWSYARTGKPYSFALNNTDKVLTALSIGIGDPSSGGSGGSLIKVCSSAGIQSGRKYWIMQDLLGRNTSRNRLTSDESLCNLPSAFTFTGTASGAVIAGLGTISGGDSIKIDASTVGSKMSVTGPAVSAAGYLTFSVWCRSWIHNRWQLEIRNSAGGLISSVILVAPGTGGVWTRFSTVGYFPTADTAPVLSVAIISVHPLPAFRTIEVDAWQTELKQHATPWVQGGSGEDSKTASVDGLAEIIEVKSVFTGVNRNIIEITDRLKFGYSARDALRSIHYWERAVSLDSDSPLRLKMITSEFRHRFREIP